MMMKLRENLHLVLYALVIVFVLTIFLSWGAGGADVFSTQGLAGVIGDKKVRVDEFQNAFNRQKEMYETQSGQKMPETQEEQFRKTVWNQMVNEYIFQKELEKRGLSLSDDEVRYQVNQYPMEQLKTNEAFLTDGKFDAVKYQATVSRDAQFAYQLLDHYSRNYSIQTMKSFVENTNVISEAQAFEDYKKTNLKANVKYLGIYNSSIRTSEIEIKDEDLKSYYEENLDKYKVDEKRKIEYIKIQIIPSKEDTQFLLDEFEIVKERILEGNSDFSDEVKLESDDAASKENDGIIDFFPKGRYSEQFDNLAFDAAINDIIGPIAHRGSFILAKVLEKRKNDSGEDEIKIQQIVKQVFNTPTTIENYDETANLALEDAKAGKDLKAIAEDYSISYDETGYILNDGFIPGIGQHAYLSSFVFSKNIADISNIIRRNQGNTMYIVKIVDIREAGYDSFDQVQGQIRSAVIQDKKSAKSKEILEKFSSEIKLKTFEEISEMKELKNISDTDSTGTVNYYNSPQVGRIGNSPELVKFILKSSAGEISEPIITSVGTFYVTVISKNELQEEDFLKNKYSTLSILEMLGKSKSFIQWVDNVKSNYNVEEYRLY